MAINNTSKSYSKMEFPLSMQRQDAFALDPTEVWSSLEAAQNYAATDPTAYVGQKLTVVTNGEASLYYIANTQGDLLPVGGIRDEDIATDEEFEEILTEIFGTNN